jgi:ComF family protein
MNEYPRIRFGRTMSEIIHGLADLAWPNLCLLCGKPLLEGENKICLDCLYELPQIREVSFRENQTSDRLLGKVQFERAASGYRYCKESKIQKALELLKYKGEKELGFCLGKMAACRLQEQGFFKEVDLLVPVPLHRLKLRKRGYNQSEWIANGLSAVSGVPVHTGILERSVFNPTQTTKNLWSRWENSQGLFKLGQSEKMEGKHLLLVDDVLTSGSTLEACSHALSQIQDVRISIFALALA